MSLIITWIVIWIVVASITSWMAGARGRNTVFGFLAGLLFGVGAIAYYLIAGDTSDLLAKKIHELNKQ